MTHRFLDHLNTPIGRLALVVDTDGRLCVAGFTESHPRMTAELEESLVPRTDPAGITSKLARYFSGELDALTGIALHQSGTPFQQEVWTALQQIPMGQTRSYSDLAKQIGRPKAVRAVGAANGANPIAIVVPCHRVIGANGTLTGYAGGLSRKRWLLAHESQQPSIPGF